MPSATSVCDPEKKKILGMSISFVKDVGRFVAWVISAAVVIVVFYFVSEREQERRVSDNKTKTEKTEERLSDHIEHAIKAFDRSTQTFDKLDRTMTAQRTLIREARETLSAVDATQQEIKKENGRLARSIEDLAREVRKRNGEEP